MHGGLGVGGWASSEYIEIGHEEPNQSNNELAATAPLPI